MDLQKVGSLLCIFFFNLCYSHLLPKESFSRELKYLNGIWNFRLCPHFQSDLGFHNQWYKSPLKFTGDVIPMPVPSSFNDVTYNETIKNHIGWAWYDKTFYVPHRWRSNNQRVVLRFGSVHYNAVVYVNGNNVVNHTGGHLPFEVEVMNFLKWEDENLITVAVNNTLTMETIPQGRLVYKDDPTRYPKGYHTQEIFFDFFNYAGIHRPVVLYTTPPLYIDDLTVKTDVLEGDIGIVYYTVEYGWLKSAGENVKCDVVLRDEFNNLVVRSEGCSGKLLVNSPKLWWPFTMHKNPGYLYTLQVIINSSSLRDVYSLPVGIRSVNWNNTNIFINHKKFYFTGFGMHEDSEIRGKGMDLPLIIRNFNMIKFLNANTFRTSHYPYADEIMDQADRQGIVVIEETPAVSLRSFNKVLLKNHKYALREMIARDKNRPSVVMWSMANEPRSAQPSAENYFREIVELAKSLDSTRPITAVLNANVNRDKAAQYLDVICINRYFGWYTDLGHTEIIQKQIVTEYSSWNRKFKRPVMISEYGAGAVVGLHKYPSTPFTEDYQAKLIEQHHMAFDLMRKKNYFIGELIWNFADFMTDERINRVDGNRKGILTRSREPKMSAYIIRRRYGKLATKNFNFSIESENNIFTPLPTEHFEL